MSANKAHPHEPSGIPCAECGGSVEEFTIPNAIWNAVIRPDGKEHNKEYLCLDCWHSALAKHLGITPKEPTLLQGHTMEQWEFMREQGFDCEFSSDAHFTITYIGSLDEIKGEEFLSHGLGRFNYCRPRRAKGVKQPWFGGKCPVAPNAEVIVFFAGGSVGLWKGDALKWESPSIIAFIEL